MYRIDRRMLSRAVSQSQKVNGLSLKAALLWSWAIPWFDPHGYLEVDPDFLKFNVVPRRDDISLQELPGLLQECSRSKLWEIYDYEDASGERKMIAFDPKFEEFQTFRRDRIGKPRYDKSLLREHSWTTPGPLPELAGPCLTSSELSRSKVKLSKGGGVGEVSFAAESIPYRQAKWFHETILKLFPKTKPKTEIQLQKQSYYIDLMMRVDKRSEEDIAKVVRWIRANDFWKSKILSTEKLRKQFDTIQAQMGGI